MQYREFVKEHFHKLPKDMKTTEKISEIAKMWRDYKGEKTYKEKPVKGGAMVSGAALKVKVRKMRGKGFLSDILSSVGL